MITIDEIKYLEPLITIIINLVILSTILVGSFISLKTYIISQRQRKLDNSLKLIDLFFQSLNEGDIEEWKNIFMSSYEGAGAKEGHFISKYEDEYQQIPYEWLFSEGPKDNGATDRIIQQIEIVSVEILKNTVDVRYVYARIGQLVTSTYGWLGGTKDSIINKNFKSFHEVMQKNQKNFKNWPAKIYSYCE